MTQKEQQKYGSVQQQYIALREINGPLMRLDLPSFGGSSLYRSVIEVTGTHLNLLDEEKQEDIHELYHRLFLNLDFPLQIIVRVQPLDIETYLHYVDTPGRLLKLEHLEDWQVLAQDHATFLRNLSKQRPLLGRRFYLVLPAEDTLAPEGGRLPSWAIKNNRQEQQHLDAGQAAQQLRTRYETLTYHLQSVGLTCRLLTGKQLLLFYKSFFVPAAFHAPSLAGPGASLEDEIAPGVITAEPDHLCIETSKTDKSYLRVLKIAHLPRLVRFGWLKQLIEHEDTFDLVQHVLPKADALGQLRRQQTHTQASVLLASRTGRSTTPEATIASNDLGPLVEEVASGEQSMLDTSIHLLIRASSLQELERKSQRLSQRCNAVFSRRPRVCFYEQASTFRSCLPGSLVAREPVLLPSHAIASMLPFFDHFIFKPSATAILEGMTQHNEPVILDWWADLPNANRLILGPSGWGKSYKAKLDILRLYYVYKRLAIREGRQHDGFQILIIDPERETNRSPGFSLIRKLGGQHIRFSPGSAHHLNPLDLPAFSSSSSSSSSSLSEADETDEKEDLLANHIQRLHKILDLMLAHNVEDSNSTLTPGEKSLLDASLYECYRECGISSDRSTHSRTAPLLRDLHSILAREVCGADSTGLAQRLLRYTQGSLSGLFSDHTNINLESTVIQFDVKDLDSELRPVALLMISNFVWTVAFGSSLPRFLFIDELASVGRYKAGQQFLEEMFARARKHYLSVTGMTQEIEMLSKSIITNSATHILLHQDETTKDAIRERFHLSVREAQRVIGFEKGEALLLANGKRMQVRFAASVQEDRLITTNRRQINKIEASAVVPVVPVVPTPLVPVVAEIPVAPVAPVAEPLIEPVAAPPAFIETVNKEKKRRRKELL